MIEIVGFLLGAAVVPQNCGADNLILVIKDDEAVHLASKTDSGDLTSVNIFGQDLHALHGFPVPVRRVLL